MEKNHIFEEYTRIIEEERKLLSSRLPHGKDPWILSVIENAGVIYGSTLQIAESAKSSLLPRSYNKIYGLNCDSLAYESVGGHTNLMSALVDRALLFIYGPDFGTVRAGHPYTIDGFSYREIMEAVRLHDLPENQIGDWPDNGANDRSKKAALEQNFFREYQKLYPYYEQRYASNKNAIRLISAMDSHELPTSDLLKVADKAAALLITLCYDSIGKPPVMHKDNPNLSERDIAEMRICDEFSEDGYFKASEMWAVDFFKMRKFNELDGSGFFTAIIVMYTLIVKGRWYTWREKDYFN